MTNLDHSAANLVLIRILLRIAECEPGSMTTERY